MANSTSSAQIADLLRPGLKRISGMNPMVPETATQIYRSIPANLGVEIDAEMKFLPRAVIRPEGAATVQVGMEERFLTSYVMQQLALSFGMTRIGIEDNQYQKSFPDTVRALKNSMGAAKDSMGAALFNNAFNTAVPGSDGVPICSLLHPTDAGPVANTLYGAQQFSQTSLESALIALQSFKDFAGLLVLVKAEKLVGPPQLTFQMIKVLGSTFNTTAADNKINPIATMDIFGKGMVSYRYLTNPNNFFFSTDAPNGLTHMERMPYELDSYADPATQTVFVTATERLSYGITNKLGLFGVQGA